MGRCFLGENQQTQQVHTIRLERKERNENQMPVECIKQESVYKSRIQGKRLT